MASPAVSCTPASPFAVKSACLIECSDVPLNDANAYDATKYPTEPELRYRFVASKSGSDDLVSELFAPNGGAHQWFNVQFPSAGSWALDLRDESDSQVATASVTVQ